MKDAQRPVKERNIIHLLLARDLRDYTIGNIFAFSVFYSIYLVLISVNEILV